MAEKEEKTDVPAAGSQDKNFKDVPKVVKKSLISLLKSAQRAINKQDIKKLEFLSDTSIHEATIYQDEDSLLLAVLLFAISKLIKREGYESEYPEDLGNYLSGAQFSLEEGNVKEYREKLKRVADFIANTDKQFKIYIEKVIEKAQIKKGSALYEHGISVAHAADLLGIGQWELMSYIGKTKIHDRAKIKARVGEKVRLARALFAEP